MPDNAALIAEPEPAPPEPTRGGRSLRLALSGIGIATLALLLVFVAVRVHGTYATERRLAALEGAHRELLGQCTAEQATIAQRLDLIERVLFGDVVPKIEQPSTLPSTRIETAILANQKEFRLRLEALERWRFRHED